MTLLLRRLILGFIGQINHWHIKRHDLSLLLSIGKTTRGVLWGLLSNFWASHYKRDMNILERLQQRAKKIIKALEHLSFEEKGTELGLFSV